MDIKSQKIREFLEEVASNAPTPGGGAVAAVTGAMAAALVEMVVNLSKSDPTSSIRLRSGLRGARELRRKLLKLADEDAAAFDAVMAAFQISKDDPGRKEKIQAAFKGAAETPLKIAKLAKEVNLLARQVLKVGNKNAASDAKTAIYLSVAALKSAIANVEINLAYIKDEGFVKKTEKAVASLKSV